MGMVCASNVAYGLILVEDLYFEESNNPESPHVLLHEDAETEDGIRLYETSPVSGHHVLVIESTLQSSSSFAPLRLKKLPEVNPGWRKALLRYVKRWDLETYCPPGFVTFPTWSP